MLTHRFLVDKVSFNPSASFTNCLLSSDFVLDSPRHTFGHKYFLLSRVKASQCSRIRKRKKFGVSRHNQARSYQENSQTKTKHTINCGEYGLDDPNLQATIALCLGPTSHSAMFLEDWAQDMYQNCIAYISLQKSDPVFFTKVLFAIDSALQIHWRSCCLTLDRSSVNDKVLMMQDCQDQILCHNFVQPIPKVLLDKIEPISNPNISKVNAFIFQIEIKAITTKRW
jgi:hypothetical protein